MRSRTGASAAVEALRFVRPTSYAWWPVFKCPLVAGFGCPPGCVQKGEDFKRAVSAIPERLSVEAHTSTLPDGADLQAWNHQRLREIVDEYGERYLAIPDDEIASPVRLYPSAMVRLQNGAAEFALARTGWAPVGRGLALRPQARGRAKRHLYLPEIFRQRSNAQSPGEMAEAK